MVAGRGRYRSGRFEGPRRRLEQEVREVLEFEKLLITGRSHEVGFQSQRRNIVDLLGGCERSISLSLFEAMLNNQ